MTHRSPFATLVFRGKRFDGAVMPLEALPELAAYRDLLAAVAREFFFAENPGRLRLPKGFADSFRLSLARIEQGSAVPIVEREVLDPHLFALGDLFDREERYTVLPATFDAVTAYVADHATPRSG